MARFIEWGYFVGLRKNQKRKPLQLLDFKKKATIEWE